MSPKKLNDVNVNVSTRELLLFSLLGFAAISAFSISSPQQVVFAQNAPDENASPVAQCANEQGTIDKAVPAEQCHSPLTDQSQNECLPMITPKDGAVLHCGNGNGVVD